VRKASAVGFAPDSRQPGIGDQPFRDAVVIITEVIQVCFRQLTLRADVGQVRTETIETLKDGVTTGNVCVLGLAGEPIADLLDDLAWVVAMILDILTRDVGNVVGVAIPFPVQDQRLFLLVAASPKDGTSDEKAKLIGHVEPGEAFLVQFCPRDVVDAQSTIRDDLDDFVNAHFP
jgi:hypothetical protein